MPAGSPTERAGGAQPNNIRFILEKLSARPSRRGVGTASDVAFAMELGVQACAHTAIAPAKDPSAWLTRSGSLRAAGWRIFRSDPKSSTRRPPPSQGFLTGRSPRLFSLAMEAGDGRRERGRALRRCPPLRHQVPNHPDPQDPPGSCEAVLRGGADLLQLRLKARDISCSIWRGASAT
jgi:hypothetical protein